MRKSIKKQPEKKRFTNLKLNEMKFSLHVELKLNLTEQNNNKKKH